MDRGGSVAEQNSVRSTHESSPPRSQCRLPPISTSPSVWTPWRSEAKMQWSVLCSLLVFIHKQTKIMPHGSVDEITLWGSFSPQRLRAQWQLEIQNKTANWISHHYTPTHWGHTMKMCGPEWRSRPLELTAVAWDFSHCCVCSGKTVSHIQLNCLILVSPTTC